MTYDMQRQRGGVGRETVEVPLSVGQSSLFFIHEMAPESTMYNMAVGITMRERFDDERLRGAWARVWARHPVLTGVVRAGAGGYAQHWYAAEPTCTVREVPGMDADELTRLVNEDYSLAFALKKEAPARLFLYQHARGSTLLMVVHHMAGDLTSLFAVCEDLLAGHREGAAEETVEPDTSYARYVAHERTFLESARSEPMRRYWAERLDGCTFALDVPGASGSTVAADAPALARFTLPRPLADGIRRTADDSGTSTATVLLAAFNVLLHKLTGASDIVVGFPIEGRKKPFKRTVGYFVNSLPLRTSVAADDRFHSVLSATHAALVGAVRHQAIPIPAVLSSVSPEVVRAIHQVSFQFEPERISHGARMHFGDLGAAQLFGHEVEAVPIRQQVGQFPLWMQIGEMEGALQGGLHFDPARFGIEDATGYVRLYEALVRDIVADATACVADLGAGWTGSD
ncbi:condensation domain-containing protein [Streptomyces flavofungini]|uniref:condensation domain-containing protein n=1 Tax=Streptomyces flavofungini TaxID=68200 RepID=UPI0025AF7000|nr:condensation domain-containing protein [Streptomyces flavofungini]WJV50737.1 condensation domain-containing protein [Streptomyces flavofungini]